MPQESVSIFRPEAGVVFGRSEKKQFFLFKTMRYDVPMTFNLGLPLCEAPAGESCEVDWQAFGGSCYKVILHPSEFNVAEERCLEHSSFLVAIGSLQENQLLGDCLMQKWIFYDVSSSFLK